MKGSTPAAASAHNAARQLLDMVSHGEQALAAEQAIIDGLNVFPVPDGDTGKNMLATVREALAGAAGAETLTEAAAGLAQGALLGARGNSGVILSQVFRGLAESVRSSGVLDAPTMRDAFERAHALAFASVSKPVEGTMLSVLGACAAVKAEADLLTQFAAEVAAAREAVARTPEQLPILAEAQVVDSGGYGLLTMLRGCCTALGGVAPAEAAHGLLGVDRVRAQVAAGGANPAELVAAPSEPYGQCVTVLVGAPAADEAAVRRDLGELGSSVLVVASGGQLKLHVHVSEPQVVLTYAASLGAIVRTDISNIDEQTAGAEGALALPIMAVAQGEGLMRLFRSLGATVVAGGPGANPSTAALLAVCDELAAR
ncbi:MAG: DAK2 domain-containing protein, partial [Chloroflexi bacterium]|nr:DAK2 domain-containing protein [Chloroflexota bacterium]